MSQLLWKSDWDACRRNLLRWWRHEGLALDLKVIRPARRPGFPPPGSPRDMEAKYLDPGYRCAQAEWEMAGLDFWAEAFPAMHTVIGPGDLGIFLGAQPYFHPDSVWYYPCIADPDAYGPIRFDPGANRWWKAHAALQKEALRRAQGRYLVSTPDLIENLDTLSAMRGNLELLMDLVERPEWVLARLPEINEAYFAAFDLIYDRIKAPDGSHATIFELWAPGKVAKVQCDFSCMISPAMYRRYVVPCLTAQCEWLDFSLYHLDGSNAMQHLDNLLAIDALDAIQWTPGAGRPGGGDPCWYDLYRRIRAGGKSVEACDVRPEQVIPLIDAIGPEGLLILLDNPVDVRTAEALMVALEPYRKGA